MTSRMPFSRSRWTDVAVRPVRPTDPDIGMNGNLARCGAESIATVNHESARPFASLFLARFRNIP